MQVAPVQALGFVTGLTLYGATETELVTAALSPRALAPSTESTRVLTYDIQLRDPADLAQARAAVRALGVSVAGAKGRKIRFYVLEDAAPQILGQMREVHQVKKIEPYIEPSCTTTWLHAQNPAAGSERDHGGAVVTPVGGVSRLRTLSLRRGLGGNFRVPVCASSTRDAELLALPLGTPHVR